LQHLQGVDDEDQLVHSRSARQSDGGGKSGAEGCGIRSDRMGVILHVGLGLIATASRLETLAYGKSGLTISPVDTRDR
jgi:hypothetical protein